MKAFGVVEPLAASAFLSPLRRRRPTTAAAASGSELDSPGSDSDVAASFSTAMPLASSPATHRASEESSQADERMAEIKAALGAGPLAARGVDVDGAEGLLRQSVACYDTLKVLHLQAEDEYNAAARILIDAAESNRVKLSTRAAQCQRKLDQTTALYSKLKLKLVNERLEYREELENLRLRLLSGTATAEGESFDSDGSFRPSPNSSRSTSPSTFSVLTENLVDGE